MSITATPLFVQSFDAECHRAYRDNKSLGETVRKKSNVEGSSHSFPKYGKGMATQAMRGSDITAMNVQAEQVKCDIEDWEAFDYVFIKDINKMKVDEKGEIAFATADAIVKREDQLIIDALKKGLDDKASTDVTEIGDGSGKFNSNMCREIRKIFGKNGAPAANRTCVVTSQQIDDMLGDEKVTSSDYATLKALQAGDIDSFCTLKFVELSDRAEGGLPFKASGKRIVFAYHKQSVGLATGMRYSSVDWIPEKRGWLIGQDYTAGAVVIDGKGVVAAVVADAS